jgi:hypothetical protein
VRLNTSSSSNVECSEAQTMNHPLCALFFVLCVCLCVPMSTQCVQQCSHGDPSTLLRAGSGQQHYPEPRKTGTTGTLVLHECLITFTYIYARVQQHLKGSRFYHHHVSVPCTGHRMPSSSTAVQRQSILLAAKDAPCLIRQLSLMR